MDGKSEFGLENIDDTFGFILVQTIIDDVQQITEELVDIPTIGDTNGL